MFTSKGDGMTEDLGWETAGQTGLAEAWGPWGHGTELGRWQRAAETNPLTRIFLHGHNAPHTLEERSSPIPFCGTREDIFLVGLKLPAT